MNDILKQRLVGALVLVALGVVFWPVVFVQSERPELDQTSQVAPMPQLAEVNIPAPQPLEGVESVDLVDQMVAEESQLAVESTAQQQTEEILAAAGSDDQGDAEVEAAPPGSPNLDEQGIPVAWVLQVASVSSREKADKLTADLIADNRKAYHRRVRVDDRDLYRVFIGPVFEREKLERVKREVDADLGVNALISRYVP